MKAVGMAPIKNEPNRLTQISNISLQITIRQDNLVRHVGPIGNTSWCYQSLLQWLRAVILGGNPSPANAGIILPAANGSGLNGKGRL